MFLNQGKFRQNGGCGYILKPKVMRDPHETGIACLVSYTATISNLCVVYTPNMTKPHPAVTPINLEITVSTCMYNRYQITIHIFHSILALVWPKLYNS